MSARFLCCTLKEALAPTDHPRRFQVRGLGGAAGLVLLLRVESYLCVGRSDVCLASNFPK